jgi:hypothetical protein
VTKISFSFERIENGWLVSELYPVNKQRQWYYATIAEVMAFIDVSLEELCTSQDQTDRT